MGHITQPVRGGAGYRPVAMALAAAIRPTGVHLMAAQAQRRGLCIGTSLDFTNWRRAPWSCHPRTEITATTTTFAREECFQWVS